MSGVITDVTITGGNDGSVDVTVTGGTPDYTYLWNDGATTQDRTGLGAGTYTVTVTDHNGCHAERRSIMQGKSVDIGGSGINEKKNCNASATG